MNTKYTHVVLIPVCLGLTLIACRSHQQVVYNYNSSAPPPETRVIVVKEPQVVVVQQQPQVVVVKEPSKTIIVKEQQTSAQPAQPVHPTVSTPVNQGVQSAHAPVVVNPRGRALPVHPTTTPAVAQRPAIALATKPVTPQPATAVPDTSNSKIIEAREKLKQQKDEQMKKLMEEKAKKEKEEKDRKEKEEKEKKDKEDKEKSEAGQQEQKTSEDQNNKEPVNKLKTPAPIRGHRSPGH